MEKKKGSNAAQPVIPGTKDGPVPPTQPLPPDLQLGGGMSPVRLDRMMESLRYAEYDINGGVGELSDNSVEEGAQNVWVHVQQEPKKFKGKSINVVSEVAVIDDGRGMSKEVLSRCLVLGDSLRPPKAGGKRGIGRFGVGMTLGAISLGRRVEVYSRQSASDPFLFTFLDLDQIQNGDQKVIPVPVPQDPPSRYTELLKGASGTMVLIKNCDRLQTDPVEREKGIAASEQIKGLATFLGRTYRKYIDAGRNIWLDGKRVYLHDPLYELGPTRFDVEGSPDLKAKLVGTENIELDVPGMPGTKADVTIRMTLLPLKWRTTRGAGGAQFAKDRKIDDNEGISILRADREVLYGSVPYILGKRGQATSWDIDRWWGCEIAFPPELDDYFHVRYIKRGAEPVGSLRDQIRDKIGPVVKQLRQQIQADFQKTENAQEKEAGIFAAAEEAMAAANAKLPKGTKGAEQTPDEEEKNLEQLVEEDVRTDPTSTEEKKQKKNELKQKEFAIVPVKYPKNVFFEPVHLLGRIVVKLNIAHPFYKEVFEPLCGTVEAMTEDSDPNQGADTPTQQLARRAFLLILLSYAKAESFFPDEEQTEMLENLRSQWGISLATAINNSKIGKKA